jgi:hypothetical protein
MGKWLALIRLSLSTRSVDVNLRTRQWVIITTVVVFIPLAWLSASIVRTAGALTLGESLHPAWIEAGIKLDPSQPGLYHRLGMLRFYSTRSPDTAGGLRSLRKAAQLAPHAAAYWRDLATACAAACDWRCADHAFHRAEALNPMAPGLHWVAANYDLGLNRSGEAFAEFRRLLAIDPGYSAPVFHLCLQLGLDPKWVWRQVIEGNPNFSVAVKWVTALANAGRLDDAYASWREAVDRVTSPNVTGRSGSFRYQDVGPFVDDMIAARRVSEAQAVWTDLLRVGLVRRVGLGQLQTDLVFNGSFVEKPLNSGFDWHLWSSPETLLSRPRVSGSAGNRALRIDFTPPHNGDDIPAFQYVAVAPGETYWLSANVKSQAIGSDSGPRLVVSDPFCAACPEASTPALTGTKPWRQVDAAFTAGRNTRLVKIAVWRPKSRSFPFEISGAFWVTSVSLTPIPAAPSTAQGGSKTGFSVRPVAVQIGH